MSDDDLKRYSKDPPEDWREVHRAVYRMDKSWPIIGPINAIIYNWKAWAVAAAIYAFLRKSEIVAALDVIVGVAP